VSHTPSSSVTARAPAKINLVLRVGSPDNTGYHPLVTVFQAVDMWDEVTVSSAQADRFTIDGDIDVSEVPTDDTNIVWRAVDAIAQHTGKRQPLHIHVVKTIPVAGGMAGGSANAAATLVAVNDLWQLGLSITELTQLAAGVGADVPFSVQGGVALGQGRGDLLTPLVRRHDLHLVVATSTLRLSTPLIYRAVDTLRGGEPVEVPAVTDPSISSVAGASSQELVQLMTNDLEQAAVSEAPAVKDLLLAVTEAGALASMVSGSGPTVWGVCESADHAQAVASTLVDRGVSARATTSTPLGAHVASRSSSPREDH